MPSTKSIKTRYQDQLKQAAAFSIMADAGNIDGLESSCCIPSASAM